MQQAHLPHPLTSCTHLPSIPIHPRKGTHNRPMYTIWWTNEILFFWTNAFLLKFLRNEWGVPYEKVRYLKSSHIIKKLKYWSSLHSLQADNPEMLSFASSLVKVSLPRISLPMKLIRGLWEWSQFLLSQTYGFLSTFGVSWAALSLLEGMFQFRGNRQQSLKGWDQVYEAPYLPQISFIYWLKHGQISQDRRQDRRKQILIFKY